MNAARHCEACGSALAHDQRYCLVCGKRAGGRDRQLDRILSRLREHRQPAVSAEQTRPLPASAGAPRWQPRLPAPWVSALLVLLFLGFGALLGDAGAGAGRLTAANRALKVLIPHTKDSARREATANTEAGGGSSSESSEPPASEAEATPAPASEESSEKSEPKSAKGGGGSSRKTKAPAAKHSAAKLTDIRHVFVIVLSDEPYAANFGPESKATYLARTLESKGELLLRYDAIAHEQLPNGIALLSGQGPTAQTAANCPSYTPLLPGTVGSDEQVLGDGCVYPAGVQTLPGQLTAKHLTWKAYLQGVDEGAGTPPACPHPASGATDPTVAGGDYAGFRDPFVYFSSIVESPQCATDVVGLNALQGDLRSGTPSFSYIVPDRCDDGGPEACASGAPTGAADSMQVLGKVVPEIMSSAAYKRGGLIAITADEAPSTGEYADSSSCCGQPPYPNLTTTGLRHGGGVIGALLLSPLIKGGTTAQDEYNHYSLLRTIEDVFGLGHLGYAALPAVKSFSASLLNAPAKG